MSSRTSPCPPKLRRSEGGFTLIELLVVIAIIAILSVVVALTLNPAEMLRRSRDANRLSDMTTISTAISHFQTDQGIISGSGSLGTSNTVYVSLPDPMATTSAGSNCSSLGLLTLPTGYGYHCAGPNYYRKTDGTGWIPINFSSITTGSPLGTLPTDPVNASSSRLYYTYTTNGTLFEATAPMESQNYGLGGANDQITNDGGTLASVYEKGSKLGLEPLDYGDASLVGNWTFAEGTGTVAYDYSGMNATGSWMGTPTGTNGFYSPGKIGPWAGTFDGGSTYVNLNASQSLGKSAVTVCAWIDSQVLTTGASIFNWRTTSNNSGLTLEGYGSSGTSLAWYINNGSWLMQSTNGWATSTWQFVSATYDGSYLHTYRNGIEIGIPVAVTGNIVQPVSPNTFIGRNVGGPIYFPGLIDDVRIYNRALSAAQIAAMYSGGK